MMRLMYAQNAAMFGQNTMNIQLCTVANAVMLFVKEEFTE